MRAAAKLRSTSPLRAAIGALIATALVGCHRHPQHRVVHDELLGALQAERITLDEASDELAIARAVLAKDRLPEAPHSRPRAGHRVFLTAWSPPHAPVVASALAATLQGSIVDAARALHEAAPELDLSVTRLQIDLALSRSPARAGEPTGRQLGRYGYLVAPSAGIDVGRLGFVLPGELLTQHLIGEEDGPELDVEGMDALLASRAGIPPTKLPHLPRSSFETLSAIESAPGGPARFLFRGMLGRPDVATLDAKAILRRFGLAADYLARIVDERGRFIYVYDARTDSWDPKRYNIIRHAGATDALLEAYEELREPRHLEAAERALAFLSHELQTDRVGRQGAKDDGAALTYLPDEDNALGPIGGTGLSLIAFAKHGAVTRKTLYLEQMRAMGAFLLHQLEPNGHFAPYFPPGVEPTTDAYREVLYYPGEAMLGLMRLYELDPDPRWLEAIERAATYRLVTPYESDRDAHRDYWYSLTLCELHRATGKAVYADRAFEIAEATMLDQDDDEAELRERGSSYGSMPRASPTGVSLEAYGADAALARFLGRDDSVLIRYARAAASLALWEQFDEESGYWLQNPARALGGIHGNPWGSEVRIDDDQHTMMGLIGLVRVLRDPSFGKVGVPSPLQIAPLRAP